MITPAGNTAGVLQQGIHMTNRKPERDVLDEFKGALELLIATANGDSRDKMLFWSAVQFLAEREGYQLCNRWEVDRMKSDYDEAMRKSQDLFNAFSNKTTHNPRFGAYY